MAEGLARLVELEEAESQRLGAWHLRTNAGKYSTEYDWVQDAYTTADRLEREAAVLEEGLRQSDYIEDDY